MSEGTQEPSSSVKSEDVTSLTEGTHGAQVAGASSGAPAPKGKIHRIYRRWETTPAFRPNQHPEHDWRHQEYKDYEKMIANSLKSKPDTNDFTGSFGVELNSSGSTLSWRETAKLAEQAPPRAIKRTRSRSSHSKLWPVTKSVSASGAHAPSAPSERPSEDAAPTGASLPPERSDRSSRKRKSSIE